MLRVLKVSQTDPKLWQKQLRNYEVLWVFVVGFGGRVVLPVHGRLRDFLDPLVSTHARIHTHTHTHIHTHTHTHISLLVYKIAGKTAYP